MDFVFDFLDSSSDEEYERCEKVYRPRREVRDEDYRKLFRFSRENVAYLAETFLPPNFETRGGALNNIQRMEIFLRYLSDPGFQVISNYFVDFPIP